MLLLVILGSLMMVIGLRVIERLVDEERAHGGEASVERLPFQGRLMTPGGQAVSEGVYRVLFSIYEAPAGGTSLWESGQLQLRIRKGGLFNVLLGDAAHPLSNLNFSKDLFLGIRLDDPANAVPLPDEPEMLPRIPVIPGLYAHRTGRTADADTLDGHDWSAILVDGAHDPTTALIRADKIQRDGLHDEILPIIAKLGADLREEMAALKPVVPGTICIWSGPIANIPEGWHLCDGTHDTPNLTDRFVIHADADQGGVNSVGQTGGEHQHTLTVNEMPSHTHSFPVLDQGFRPGHGVRDSIVDGQRAATEPTGGGAPHENRPKFYALAYIMKL